MPDRFGPKATLMPDSRKFNGLPVRGSIGPFGLALVVLPTLSSHTDRLPSTKQDC
jgi:hypothetical protein